MKKIKTHSERVSGRFGAALAVMALLLAVCAGQAQDTYHPITDGCIWSVSNEKYMTIGDTILDGKAYLKIYRQIGDQPFNFSLEDAEYFAAIRNDSAERRVYVYLPAGTSVSDYLYGNYVATNGMEVVLYDFSLPLGDTVTYYTIHPTSHAAMAIHAHRTDNAYILTGYDNGQSQYMVYLDSDSLITISDGSTRRRILMYSDITGQDEVWIEGIGRLRGFDDCHISEIDNPSKILICYSDSLGVSYQTGFEFDGIEDCFSNGFGGDVTNIEKLNVKIYPNPVAEKLHISAQQLDDNYLTVHVFNMMGICVHSETIVETVFDKEINLKFLPKGIYMVELKNLKKITTQKIIKQ